MFCKKVSYSEENSVESTLDERKLDFYLVEHLNDCPICLNFQELPVIIDCDHVFCKECLLLNEEVSLLKSETKEKSENLNGKYEEILNLFEKQVDKKKYLDQMNSRLEIERKNRQFCCPICHQKYTEIYSVKFMFLKNEEKLVGERMIFRKVSDSLEESTSFEDFGSFPYNSAYHSDKSRVKLNHQTKPLKMKRICKRDGFEFFGLIQKREDIFYQNIDGARIFIGLNYLDRMRQQEKTKKHKRSAPFGNLQQEILPDLLCIKIKTIHKMKNLGRIGHLDWECEIAVVDGE